MHSQGVHVQRVKRSPLHAHLPGSGRIVDRRLTHLRAVSPGQLWIGQTLTPGSFRRLTAQVGGDQLLPALRRQRSAQQNDGHPVGAQPGQRRIQVLLHIRIIGMDFIDDHDLATQPQVS